MYFDDGTNPTMEMTREFIDLADNIISAGGESTWFLDHMDVADGISLILKARSRYTAKLDWGEQEH